MKKFILGVLILSGCAASENEKPASADQPADGRTFQPFHGKYVHKESNLFRSFFFKENQIVDVEVVPGHIETYSYIMDGNRIEVSMANGAKTDFTLRDDQTLLSGHGIGTDENFVYVKEN